MKKTLTLSILILFSFNSFAQKVNWKNIKVLVYTKNGKGYVHENIPFAVEALKQLAQTHGFKIDVSDNPSVFTKENLQQYKFLVFTSTNNDVFDNDSQRLAFRHYIEAGGGLVGVHSVVGTERNWTWFKQFIGGTFSWHPHFQKLKIKTIDAKHPSIAGFPDVWEKDDECYFEKEF